MLLDPFQHLLKRSDLRRLDVGILVLSHNRKACLSLAELVQTKHPGSVNSPCGTPGYTCTSCSTPFALIYSSPAILTSSGNSGSSSTQTTLNGAFNPTKSPLETSV